MSSPPAKRVKHEPVIKVSSTIKQDPIVKNAYGLKRSLSQAIRPGDSKTLTAIDSSTSNITRRSIWNNECSGSAASHTTRSDIMHNMECPSIIITSPGLPLDTLIRFFDLTILVFSLSLKANSAYFGMLLAVHYNVKAANGGSSRYYISTRFDTSDFSLLLIFGRMYYLQVVLRANKKKEISTSSTCRSTSLSQAKNSF